MGIGMKRRRKDFMYAKQIFEMIGYFFDMEDTQGKDEFRMDMEDVKTILNSIFIITPKTTIPNGLTS